MRREKVTVIRPIRVDKYRDPSEEPAPEHDVARCKVWPRSSLEEGKGWITLDGLNVLMPAGADVKSGDQVRVRGDVYNVEGRPADYGRPGVLVTLTTVRRT